MLLAQISSRCGALRNCTIGIMCMLNISPYKDDSNGPLPPLPRGRPRLGWMVPVNLSRLGASLQAIADTALQTQTLRLCHRGRYHLRSYHKSCSS
jgi:hypothetical protein